MIWIFLLGAFFSQIIVLFSGYCKENDFMPTLEEAVKYNHELFSRAQMYKGYIQKIVGN